MINLLVGLTIIAVCGSVLFALLHPLGKVIACKMGVNEPDASEVAMGMAIAFTSLLTALCGLGLVGVAAYAFGGWVLS